MKRLIILQIVLFLSLGAIAQVFPSPSGNQENDPDKSKTIKKCSASASSGIQALKLNTSARRFTFDIALWPELYQWKGKKTGPCWPSITCKYCDYCDNGDEVGWNKIGRITFVRNTNTDNNKLHLGWRADPINNNKLKLSAYYHEVDWGSKAFPDYFVSYYIKSVNVDTEQYIDMYMSFGTISMIIDDCGLVIRKPGMIPDNKHSFLTRTFYYGDKWLSGNCLSPQDIKVEFRNQKYDYVGYQYYLNECKYVTVNISEFIEGDDQEFYAFEWIRGSIPDNELENVQYEKGHPNPIKQKCIISIGANITFSSGEKVILNHGFHAKPGSHFSAKIVQKEKYPGYYDEPQKLNLPPLDQSGECSRLPDSSNTLEDTDYYKIDENDYLVNQESLVIYPNPNPGQFNIELFEKGVAVYSIEIVNTIGKTVYKKQNIPTGKTEIDISNHTKGVYFIKIRVGDKLITEKVVYR